MKSTKTKSIAMKRLSACVAAACLLLQVGNASALGLVDAYRFALESDSTYRSIKYESDAGKQAIAIGRSTLLPSLSMNYSTSSNRSDITAPNIFGQISTSHPAYTSKSGVISLRQPLLNLEGVARYYQGVAQANYSQARLVSGAQDLILRLVSAYVQAQYTNEQVALTVAQRDTLLEQKQLNENMFRLGESTKTDVLETQSKLDLAETQIIEARDNQRTALNTLSSIIGRQVSELDPLTNDFQTAAMDPITFEEWKELALQQNADIAQQRYTVDSARQEVNKNRSGHAPRLDMVASVSKSTSETLSTLNQDARTRSVGVQLAMPIYSGGYVDATTKQAIANYERAKADLAAKVEKTLVELHKQYDLVQSTASRVEALTKAVESARLLVEATKQSVKGGVRINLDVLNAQQELYTSLRDLAQARYGYLLSYLQLRFQAGTLGNEDLEYVATYFVAPLEKSAS